MKDIEKIRQNYAKEQKHLNDLHRNKIWADWLRHKAEEGDKDAITALRYRNRKNQSNYALSGESSDFILTDIKQVDSITKEGTEIYKVGESVIRNVGKEIKISKGGSIAALKKALEMAQQQYGSCIRVIGSPLFKQIMLQISVRYNKSITFADPDMEVMCQQLVTQRENSDEQSKRCGFNDGGRASRGNEVAGAALGGRRNPTGSLVRTKPNAVSTRQGPPAEGQNSLRGLPQLDVVQLTDRGEVLLQGDAHDKLERQRLKSDNHVRRKVSGLNQKNNNHKHS